MKENRLVFTLLFLLSAAVFQLPAQQNEADRKLVAEIRARAEMGDAKSQERLGVAFFLGKGGLTKDEVEAVKWFRKAAEQNVADAQYNLGVCYANGQGVTEDDAEAVKWFRKAAEQNQADAQYAPRTRPCRRGDRSIDFLEGRVGIFFYFPFLLRLDG
jgi:TPR repeat protein